MKLLTICVPCYNKTEDIRPCVESLLTGGEDIEIILIQDTSSTGRKDASLTAADYAASYPSMVRVIEQPLSGQGDGINTGLLHATGLYFKVINSCDQVDPDGYFDVIRTLRSLAAGGCMLDMMITNAVYEKSDSHKKKTVRYQKALPVNQLFDWSETGNFKTGQYLPIQSVIFRTQLLRDCHLILPMSNHYAESLYVYTPLPYVSTIYYRNVDFHHSHLNSRRFLSEDTDTIYSLIDQHLAINKLILDAYDLRKINNRALRRYMLNYLEIITAISTLMLAKTKGKESQERRKEFWEYIRNTDPRLYHKLRQRLAGQTLPINNLNLQLIPLNLYQFSQKIIHRKERSK